MRRIKTKKKKGKTSKFVDAGINRWDEKEREEWRRKLESELYA